MGRYGQAPVTRGAGGRATLVCVGGGRLHMPPRRASGQRRGDAGRCGEIRGDDATARPQADVLDWLQREVPPAELQTLVAHSLLDATSLPLSPRISPHLPVGRALAARRGRQERVPPRAPPRQVQLARRRRRAGRACARASRRRGGSLLARAVPHTQPCPPSQLVCSRDAPAPLADTGEPRRT